MINVYCCSLRKLKHFGNDFCSVERHVTSIKLSLLSQETQFCPSQLSSPTQQNTFPSVNQTSPFLEWNWSYSSIAGISLTATLSPKQLILLILSTREEFWKIVSSVILYWKQCLTERCSGQTAQRACPEANWGSGNILNFQKPGSHYKYFTKCSRTLRNYTKPTPFLVRLLASQIPLSKYLDHIWFSSYNIVANFNMGEIVIDSMDSLPS